MRGRVIPAVALTAVAALLAAPPALGAGTLTERQALRKTAQIARTEALKLESQGAVSYYAFGCRRSTRLSGVCIGAVLFADNSACGQEVKVSKSRRTGRVSGRKIGQPLCGDLPNDADTDGDGRTGSGSGEGTAICAIRQSVCI